MQPGCYNLNSHPGFYFSQILWVQMEPKLRLNSYLLPALTITALILQLIDPSRIWTTIFIGLGLTWLSSYWWVRTLARKLEIKREMRFGWAQVGDRLEERFTLHNRGIIPALWIEILDHSDIPGYQPSRVTGVNSGSRIQWRTEVICIQRGLFTLGPTSLECSDPFGLYKLTLHNKASTSIMVMPPVIPLPEIQVTPGGYSGNAKPRTNAPERTVSAASVREYTPGDSLRWIHWRTSARRASPYVRIFDGTPAGDWWIFLDLDQNVQAGESWDSTHENSIIMAASLADIGLKSAGEVGLVANGDPLIWLPPLAGDDQRLKILRSLALVDLGKYSLSELFVRNKSAIGQRSSLVIITPNQHTDWIEALLPLMWRGAVPTVLLLDTSTFDGQGNVQPVINILADLGVKAYIITRDMLDRPEARPGREGHWEWLKTATGHAFPLSKPSKLNWKVLT